MRRRNSFIRAEVDISLPASIDWREFSAYAEAQLEAIATEVRNEARASSAFADKTGTLRKSIKIKRERGDDGERVLVVAATAPHAHLVEFGTQGPRKSTKQGRMFLDGVWASDGGLIFAKEVRAMPACPFLRPALAKVMARRMAGFAAGGGAHADFGMPDAFGWEG